MSKKRRELIKKERKQKETQQRNYLLIGGFFVAIAIVAGLYFINQSGGIGSIPLRDIHGISFTPDGELYVATHEGLLIYDETWSVPDVLANDYMGYSGTSDGFYSSGHPGPTSNFPNPLGLVHSSDFGATISTLKFLGESDFHTMAASYRGDAVYISNPAPNSELEQGLYYTVDDGQSWVDITANGLSEAPFSIAVHPDDSTIVAAAARSGTYLSRDSGENFQLVQSGLTSAVAFDTGEGTTLYSGFQGLTQYNMADASSTTFNIPSFSEEEAIMFIAVSPVDGRIALATSERDVYLSDGDSWQQIAEVGFTS